MKPHGQATPQIVERRSPRTTPKAREKGEGEEKASHKETQCGVRVGKLPVSLQVGGRYHPEGPRGAPELGIAIQP
jgi:hypothetical protein